MQQVVGGDEAVQDGAMMGMPWNGLGPVAWATRIRGLQDHGVWGLATDSISRGRGRLRQAG